MNKIKIRIWGRSFSLDVLFGFYEDKGVTSLQKRTLESFIKDIDVIESSLENVKEYCLKEESLRGIDYIDNIFKYVMPHTVYVKQIKDKCEVAILCDYKLDIEHGLAIIYKDGKLKDMGEQGII